MAQRRVVDTAPDGTVSYPTADELFESIESTLRDAGGSEAMLSPAERAFVDDCRADIAAIWQEAKGAGYGDMPFSFN